MEYCHAPSQGRKRKLKNQRRKGVVAELERKEAKAVLDDSSTRPVQVAPHRLPPGVVAVREFCQQVGISLRINMAWESERVVFRVSCGSKRNSGGVTLRTLPTAPEPKIRFLDSNVVEKQLMFSAECGNTEFQFVVFVSNSGFVRILRRWVTGTTFLTVTNLKEFFKFYTPQEIKGKEEQYWYDVEGDIYHPKRNSCLEVFHVERGCRVRPSA